MIAISNIRTIDENILKNIPDINFDMWIEIQSANLRTIVSTKNMYLPIELDSFLVILSIISIECS